MSVIGGYTWYFGALFLVVGLILALAWIARRLGVMGRLAATGTKRRLAIVEVLPLDAKRRLVLLRRDGAEHLVLIGLTGDIVIERAIGSSGAPGSFASALEGTHP
ncbi:MAG TPA: flagellar biosynthetic protein FliO [Stellaceae bacterium]|nr:flagellar biosynthetic protein FliO [Stellaceae bacterium]